MCRGTVHVHTGLAQVITSSAGIFATQLLLRLRTHLNIPVSSLCNQQQSYVSPKSPQHWLSVKHSDLFCSSHAAWLLCLADKSSVCITQAKAKQSRGMKKQTTAGQRQTHGRCKSTLKRSSGYKKVCTKSGSRHEQTLGRQHALGRHEQTLGG